MSVAAGDVVRVVAKFSWGADEALNVFHVKHVGSSSVDDATFMSGVASVLETAYNYIDGFMSSGLDFTSIEAFNVTQDAPIDEVAWPTLTSGSDGGSIYALQCAPLVKFGTNVARSQGRKFIPGATETNIDGVGVVGSTFSAALLQYAIHLIVTHVIGGEDFKFGNWNEALSRFAEWAYGEVAQFVATQRRRKPGVGS